LKTFGVNSEKKEKFVELFNSSCLDSFQTKFFVGAMPPEGVLIPHGNGNRKITSFSAKTTSERCALIFETVFRRFWSGEGGERLKKEIANDSKVKICVKNANSLIENIEKGINSKEFSAEELDKFIEAKEEYVRRKAGKRYNKNVMELNPMSVFPVDFASSPISSVVSSSTVNPPVFVSSTPVLGNSIKNRLRERNHEKTTNKTSDNKLEEGAELLNFNESEVVENEEKFEEVLYIEEKPRKVQVKKSDSTEIEKSEPIVKIQKEKLKEKGWKNDFTLRLEVLFHKILEIFEGIGEKAVKSQLLRQATNLFIEEFVLLVSPNNEGVEMYRQMIDIVLKFKLECSFTFKIYISEVDRIISNIKEKSNIVMKVLDIISERLKCSLQTLLKKLQEEERRKKEKELKKLEERGYKKTEKEDDEFKNLFK